MTIRQQAPAGTGTTRWGAVLAVSLGIVVGAMDMTIVAVALPTLGADFDVAPSVTQWVQLTYLLALVALSIPAGRWLDRAGPLPSFLLAIGGFGVASVLIAVAPTLPLLLAGRVLQGVFGALLGVVGMPIVALTVRPEHRARAMSLVLTLIPLSGVAGPGLGGLLSDAYGWRSVFLINIPVVLVAAWVAMRAIPRRTEGRQGLPPPHRQIVRETLVLGAAAAALFLGLDLLGRGQPPTWPVVLGVLTVAGVLVWLRLPESVPVLGLLRRRAIGFGLIALPMITAGQGALNFMVPYFLTEARDLSPALIGVTLLTMAGGMAVCSPVAGVLADRFGTRPLVIGGTVLTLAGTASLLFVGPDTSAVDLAVRLVVIGVGNGLFAGPNSTAILTATPTELAGTSGGVTALVRTMGFAVGPAVGALAFGVTATATGALHTGSLVMSVAALIAVMAVLATPGRPARL